MINVTVFYSDDFSLKGFTVDGHALMSGPGEYDLVCASVSAIAQTALLGLDAYLSIKPVWEIADSGHMECWLPDGIGDTELKIAEVIVHTMELGLISIEEAYGKCLKVSKRRWTKCCSK